MTRLLLIALALLLTAGHPLPQYDRTAWGRWADADGDCQDARAEVLIAESLAPVQLDRRGCRVLKGLWRCPYTGRLLTDARQVEVDHVVPLKEAHDSGGARWPAWRKRAYYSDLAPEHLAAVSKRANRQKGARDPARWLPQQGQCSYLQAWAAIKARWGLGMDPAERTAVAHGLASCPENSGQKSALENKSEK